MRYFFLILLISFPLLAMASYEDELRLCKHLLRDECDRVSERYWWGDKFDEVNSQAQELQEAMRYAVLNDDYSEIKKYITFPFIFGVEDGRGDDVSSRRDFKYYKWVAYNLHEFGYWFRNFKEPGVFLIQDLIDQPYTISYSAIGYIDLGSVYHSVLSMVTCSAFTPTKKKTFYVLPQNLNLCQNTSIKIQNINFRIYH